MSSPQDDSVGPPDPHEPAQPAVSRSVVPSSDPPPRPSVTLDLSTGGAPTLLDPDATIRPQRVRSRGDRPARPRPKPAPRLEGSGATLRITGELAEGGMGVIHLGEQAALRREVAVKALKPDGDDDDAIARLLAEARITGIVEHPNIIPIYSLQPDEESRPLMVMKRIHGVTWRALIRDPEHPAFPTDARDKLEWHLGVLMNVCDAVHFAHSRGILHLDLKPDNVLIGGYRDIYVADWGVAASVDESHRGWLPMADELREIVGTPHYMAPEMVDRASSVLTRRTDVYLLGATLYELLTGQPPHRADNVRDVLLAAYESRPPDYDDDVPEGLATIATRAMDPRGRGSLRERGGFSRGDRGIPRASQLGASGRSHARPTAPHSPPHRGWPPRRCDPRRAFPRARRHRGGLARVSLRVYARAG